MLHSCNTDVQHIYLFNQQWYYARSRKIYFLIVATYNEYVLPSLLFFLTVSKSHLVKENKVIEMMAILNVWGRRVFIFLCCGRITSQWCGHWIPITIMFSYLEGNKEGNILCKTLIRCLWAFIWQIDILYT